MVIQYKYESAQIAAETKEIAVRTALLELQEALETYRWNVNGLASAE